MHFAIYSEVMGPSIIKEILYVWFLPMQTFRLKKKINTDIQILFILIVF